MKKLKRLVAISGIFFSFLTITKAEGIQLTKCAYTEAYKQYLSLSKEEQQRTFPPVMCQEEYASNGLQENPLVTSSITDSKFDLRDESHINTTILDQGDAGICWGIATMESIQSSLLKEKEKSYDFSEGHLELATQKTYDFNRLTFNRKINIGGNYYLAAAYLLNHWGPVNESVYSLNKLQQTLAKTYTPKEDEVIKPKNNVDVNQIMISHANQGSCTETSKKAIKQYLVTNGALAAMGYFDIYGQGATISKNEIKGTFTNGPYYYYDGSAYKNLDEVEVEANAGVNHGITIIGWDDTISKSKFAPNHQPEHDGAWIIKNSWGTKLSDNTKVGDNGYFYVSYDDVNICSTISGFYDIDITPTDNAYYHDDLGYNTMFTANESVKNIYLGSIYSKKNEEEELEKVTFASLKENQEYKVYFANNATFTDLELVGSGTTNHSGYTTVKLTKPKKITNSKFSVVVEYLDDEQMELPASISAANTMFSTAVIKKASTYLSADKINWIDTSENASTPFQLTVRAYTNTINTPTPCTSGDGKYYGTSGEEVTLEAFEQACNPKCSLTNNQYYDQNGHVVDQATYEDSCNPKCEIKNNKFYNNKGQEVDQTTYEKECNPKCSIVENKYYDQNGHVIDQDTFNQECNPKCAKQNDKYYNSKGQEVSKDSYEQDCIKEELPQNNGTSIDIQENEANKDIPSNEIENPPTGNFLPIFLFAPLTGIGIYVLYKTQKKKIYKL